MVVRLVKPPDTAAESEPLAVANSVSADATEHAGDGLTDWTFLGSVPSSVPMDVSQLHGVSQDVPLEHESSHGLFGEPLEFSVDENDPDAVSLSAEPSIARSSDVRLDDRQVQTRTVTAFDEFQSFDTTTALEVAARSIPAEPIEQVWEQGVWGVIFGNKSLVDVYEPYGTSLKRPIDTSSQGSLDVAVPPSSRLKSVSTTGLSYHDVVKDKPDIPWQEQRDADLQSSVKLWMALVNRWDSGCSLVTATLELAETSRIFNMFAHLFAGRSPVTIKKRGYSLMRLCDYLDGRGLTFPCSERHYYDFLCGEQECKAPQSRLKGYMQSINFVRHVMAVPELESLTSSSRCKGACFGDLVQERIQASPLKVQELRHIHELLYSGEDMWVRMFCGAVLMTVYCRARWGDLMRSENIILDYDHAGELQFIEARTGRHKTMRSQLHRHQFLPMVAPCHGIDGRDWGSVWLEVRKSLEIEWPPDGLVMPAPGLQGQSTCRPLETQECAAWLRKIVGSQGSDTSRRISSHSMKSTFLSYAAKRGIGIPERLQLGYHTSSFQMGMVYSRDGAAASILVLEKLIKEIETGQFDPDNTRSGRIKTSAPQDIPAGAEAVVHIKDEVEVIEVSGSESEMEPDSSSTSSEEERPKTFKFQPVLQPTSAPPGFVFWQHKKLKTLHLMSEDNRKVFSCGRSAGPLHERLESAPEFDTPLCSLCFSKTSS